MAGGILQPLRIVGVLFGGMITLSVASKLAIHTLQVAVDAKRKKYAVSCAVCKGQGFYSCKLCKGTASIEWSPLYDPIFINPCLCPTCEGNRVQRCLNCLGKGYH